MNFFKVPSSLKCYLIYSFKDHLDFHSSNRPLQIFINRSLRSLSNYRSLSPIYRYPWIYIFQCLDHLDQSRSPLSLKIYRSLPQTHLDLSPVDDVPLLAHVRHVRVHALLLLALTRLESGHSGHEELWRAVAVALDLLQGGLQQAVGHLIPS